MTRQPSPPPVLTAWPPFSIGVLLVLICLPELVIWAADMGWVGSRLWRPLSVQNGAFWPGLLDNWRPNYAAQPWTMFLTYSVLHIGPVHMLGNALALLWLGPQVIAHMGRGGFWLVWGVSAIVGGASFALLSGGTTPMVGASGCVFGLLGAAVAHQYLRPGRLGMVLAILGSLVALHLVTLVVEDGLLAWQPHLGGYLAGTLLALCRPSRQDSAIDPLR